MKKEELLELSDTLRGIAEGKTWEYRLNNAWIEASPSADVMIALNASGKIRLKPWSLPPPPEGQQWHRSDGWTKEMLPEGYRPLLLGEKRMAGDEYLNNGTGPWMECFSTGVDIDHRFVPHRTRRPLPQTQQPDPYAELKAAHAAGKVIQCNANRERYWFDLHCPSFRAPVENYRIKPEMRRVPLTADDIKSSDEFLAPDGNRYQWNAVHKIVVMFLGNVSWSFQELMENGWQIRSVGETEWRPCWKEVEA